MIKDFNNLGVSQEIVNVLNNNRITVPTPIQSQVIPLLMDGKDVIGQAQTGTGKTLAFVLPMIENIETDKSSVQGLIITPTRELAIQITEEIKKIAPTKGINILAAYGGQDVERQIHKLKGGIHIVIGTPGRLLDHLRRKTINFGQLKFLVLDEADQMLQMGFLGEVEEIIAQTPKRRQTMLFSATMPDGITKLASRYMENPYKIKADSEKVTLTEIKQLIIETTDRGKQTALFKFISENSPFLAIIFCRTKLRTRRLNEVLIREGYNSDELHGDLSQAKRERVMKSFRDAEIQYLVATDIAARGLDVEGVTHVINYDLPYDTESYIHRIGRTGRAGHTGLAVTFVTPKDREDLITIEKGIKMTIKKQQGEIEKADKRNDINSSGENARKDKKARMGKNERSNNKDRDKKPRPGKNDKFDKNERPGKNDRFDKNERPGKNDRVDKSERPGKNDRFDKNERPAKNDRFDKNKKDRPTKESGRGFSKSVKPQSEGKGAVGNRPESKSKYGKKTYKR